MKVVHWASNWPTYILLLPVIVSKFFVQQAKSRICIIPKHIPAIRYIFQNMVTDRNKPSSLSLREGEVVEKSLGSPSKTHQAQPQNFCWIISRTLLLILFYYSTSIGLTFYQKRLLVRFHYPLTIVTCHLVIKFLLATLCRLLWECHTEKRRVVLSWRLFVHKIAPAAIASALDIGLSNWSFEFITVSLYTMSKSTAIVFITGFALYFKLEKKHWSLVVVVLMIASGLVMFTYQATQFNWTGFIMVLSAAFLSGLRWTLSQLVMQKSELGLSNPVDMMYHMQPWMIVTLLPFFVGFEGLSLASTESVFRFSDISLFSQRLFEILLGAVLAFLMELTEYLLVSYTSSLTLAVAGIVKEVVTLIFAIVLTHDELNAINAAGLVICLFGIILHVSIKAWRVREEAKLSVTEASQNAQELMMEPLLSGSETDDDEKVLFQQRM